MSKKVFNRDWGESLALLGCLVLFIVLRNRYTIGGPGVTLAVGLAIATVTALSFVLTIIGAQKRMQVVMLVAGGVLAAANATAMVKIIILLTYSPANIDAHRLLNSALGILVLNVVMFAVFYKELGEQDFAFPPAPEGTTRSLVFFDFLFLAFTTATAFSPTDTAPLTTRARMAMMAEAVISLATLAIVAARAVNIL